MQNEYVGVQIYNCKILELIIIQEQSCLFPQMALRSAFYEQMSSADQGAFPMLSNNLEQTRVREPGEAVDVFLSDLCRLGFFARVAYSDNLFRAIWFWPGVSAYERQQKLKIEIGHKIGISRRNFLIIIHLYRRLPRKLQRGTSAVNVDAITIITAAQSLLGSLMWLCDVQAHQHLTAQSERWLLIIMRKRPGKNKKKLQSSRSVSVDDCEIISSKHFIIIS